MKPIVRIILTLTLLFTALLYWLGDFNTYQMGGFINLLDGRPGCLTATGPGVGLRLAYSTAIAVVCGIGVGSLFFPFREWGDRFVVLILACTAILFVWGDLNLYLGLLPDGSRWVKGRTEWSFGRFVFCQFLGIGLGVIVAIVLWVVTQIPFPWSRPQQAPDNVDGVGDVEGTRQGSVRP